MLLPAQGRWSFRTKELRLFPSRDPMLSDCLKKPSERRIEWILPDLNCRVRVSCHVDVLDALVTKRATMKAEKYRIVEWTSMFSDGSRTVSYELQSQTESNPKKWCTLGTSPTLADARKALLFHAPNISCGFS